MPIPEKRNTPTTTRKTTPVHVLYHRYVPVCANNPNRVQRAGRCVVNSNYYLVLLMLVSNVQELDAARCHAPSMSALAGCLSIAKLVPFRLPHDRIALFIRKKRFLFRLRHRVALRVHTQSTAASPCALYTA